MQSVTENVKKLASEVKFLEQEVEMQAYVSGLWVRYFNTIKQVVNREFPESRLADMVNSTIKESSSWEDVWEWLDDAKKAEQQFFETVKEDVEKETDVNRLRTEVNYLKGIVRALLSTRETRIEKLLNGYIDWNSEVDREIEVLLNESHVRCVEE